MTVLMPPKGLSARSFAREKPFKAPAAKASVAAEKRWAPGVEAPKSAAYVTAQIGRLERSFTGLTTDQRTVFEVLERHTAPVVTKLEREFQRSTGRTLRRSLNEGLSGTSLRRALKPLDAAMVNPADTTGLSGVAEKVLTLRNQGSVSESELVTQYRPTQNNKLKLLIKGTEAFPEIFKAIDKAKDHVHVSFYIVNNDALGNAFADKLIAAKKRGVRDVRVMLDGVGSTLLNPWSGGRKILKRLEHAGIETRYNHPVDVSREQEVLNHPDHRKLVIVDGKVGFTGGMNVADHYMSKYHDVMVRAEGDVVAQMQSEWMQSWLHLGGTIKGDDAVFLRRFFPSRKSRKAPSTGATATVSQHIPGENRGILNTYLSAIAKAEKKIRIENAYCTNPEIQNALIAAAKRGVDVGVILPGESDHAFSHLAAAQKYPEMIKAGVKIYEYPGFNHDKVMMVDDKFVTLGSSNLDDVALYHVYELNLNVENEAFAKEVDERLFKKDIGESKLMKADDIGRLKIITGKFWNLFSHYI
jgi:cardiolipin synthase